ncbi:MAG: hypothetical protein COW73_03020 [Nitrospirae bacterium CG18_big_fil_WC_8_21_14_2_50_70_55]|nr:HIT family protein [Deltaproteobacteria bacterium]OIP64810.1 MAG: hypothetical protein AUK30_06015 [Nitrospirae bacterium CG2_30_70_394]PIQ06614.1 MAG: hypothetical protein COW73_03020 [Nitrospirae bacterium CG18_big_fil_WC_8_21_14_2_50_70_55]PIU78558.1 MAG: hypothetical protein COS73_06815 [Nitrospirae bacterium CG06_land_8_20_14_3_00_70_43]PIW82871.1 MAG: hypothetical protein COZ96_06450 [Nitrospirae bacterium CG_4_8_14_3_um_filter_70_85]PIX83453.1 MAG: hypothetical protein COZ33_05375 [N
MAELPLDPRLAADCHLLGRLATTRLLLRNDQRLPWFLLVPATAAVEVCDLEPAAQQALWAQVNEVALLVRTLFPVDKLNVAAIGNVVRQLHLHVVGRRHDDYAWPGVVWGLPGAEAYPAAALARIRAAVAAHLGDRFVVAGL